MKAEKLLQMTPSVSPLYKFVFVTCGDWDLKTMLNGQTDHFQVPTRDYFHKWVNLKKIYHKATGTWPKGMMYMLDELKLKHQGRHHSGIDDCKNIAEISKVLGRDKQVVFKVTSRLEM